jgi:excisionase family DNA binding protein
MTLMTVQEVAKTCQVHDRTVRRWIRDKQLPAVYLGTKQNSAVRVDKTELERWLYDR